MTAPRGSIGASRRTPSCHSRRILPRSEQWSSATGWTSTCVGKSRAAVPKRLDRAVGSEPAPPRLSGLPGALRSMLIELDYPWSPHRGLTAGLQGAWDAVVRIRRSPSGDEVHSERVPFGEPTPDLAEQQR